MKSRIFSIILSVFLFSQFSFAQLCAKLVAARCGETHTLALSESGALFSCGTDLGGQLGLGVDNVSFSSLQPVKGLNGNGYLRNVIAFDAGWYHSLVVVSDGSCYSFGYDNCGQLGNGSDGSSNVPVRVHGVNDVGYLQNIVKISAGRSGTHSLAINSNGTTYAWHNNLNRLTRY